MPTEDVIIVDDALKNRTIELFDRAWSGGRKRRMYLVPKEYTGS